MDKSILLDFRTEQKSVSQKKVKLSVCWSLTGEGDSSHTLYKKIIMSHLLRPESDVVNSRITTPDE